MKTNHVKRTFALAASALAISTAVVGCRDYDVMDEGLANQVAYAKEYDANFISRFGTPDPTHSWGMDDEIGVIGAFSVLTRGEVNTNRNQWTEFSTKTSVTFPTYNYAPRNQVKVPIFTEGKLGHDIQIPGFPHLNGLYYPANGDKSAPTKTGDQITSGMVPAGDVTPYEIQYVSNWFRTHPNPGRIPLHLSDFFIQNISWDNDQVAYNTSGITPYQTGWDQTGNNGKNIETVDEAKAHKTATGGDYIVNGVLNERIQYSLDQLGFLDMNNEWYHVNNFNSGNSNFDPEDKESNSNRMIMYVTSTGTEGFRCHPSWCTDTEWIESYALVHLTWYETVKDSNSPYPVGTVIPREGYYLGFDFHGTKAGQTVNPDGYYSNWIVKITPGHFNPTGHSRRIFCEDLGGSFDYDFNDAVVDVAFEQKGTNQYQPIITVQAAGGTMPIYIEKNGTSNPAYSKYELHYLLGQSGSDYKPINVGSTGGSHAVATYRGEIVTSNKASAIHIYVKNTKNNTNYDIAGNQSSDEDTNGTHSVIGSGDGTGTPTLEEDTQTKKTITPSAFSAPTSVKWLKELQGIELAYEHFGDWVGNHAWASDGKKWYEIIKPGAPLYDASQIQVEPNSPTSHPEEYYNDQVSWTSLTPDPSSSAAPASVNADSYLRVEGYRGDEESVFSQLDTKGSEGRMTITIVLSSTIVFNQNDLIVNGDGSTTKNTNILQGIIVPADISGSTMSYKGAEFAIDVMKSFKKATFVKDEDIVNSTDKFSGRHTYIMEFSFTKADIQKGTNAETGKAIYHDYLLFFLKTGSIAPGTGDATGVNGDVKVERWYVHY